MQYMGGKTRIAKELVEIMSAERDLNMTWVEPFVGSAKVIEKVNGKRIGADINQELISLFNMIQNGYKPPRQVSKELYNHIKNNQDQYSDHLKGFVSFACSFGGRRWASYATNKKNQNFALMSYRTLIKQKPFLKGVKFICSDYQSLELPTRSLIYCDPPYKNTAGYGFDFDHEIFYKWCLDRVAEGHLVFISEYNSPFELAWSKEINIYMSRSTNNIKKVEKLYRVHKKQTFKLWSY